MKKSIFCKIILFSVVSFVIFNSEGVADKNECKKHIELLSAEIYAKELDRNVMSVLANYRIYLWQKETPKGKGKPVGKMIPGSRAAIIKEGVEDYKVKSPLDKSLGWINKMHVQRTLYQNTETRKPCN